MAFRVLIIGGTGQVGAAVVRALAAEPSCAEVVMVNRRTTSLTADPRVRQVILDTAAARFPAEVTKLAQRMVAQGDPVYAASCVGVGKGSMKWSEEELKALEIGVVGGFARGCQAGGITQFSLLSAAGSSAKSRIRYARIMGLKEEAVQAIGFQRLAIFRPGIIAGNAHTPQYVAWLGRLIPGPFGTIEQDDIGRAFVAEFLNGSASNGVAYLDNAAMRQGSRALRRRASFKALALLGSVFYMLLRSSEPLIASDHAASVDAKLTELKSATEITLLVVRYPTEFYRHVDKIRLPEVACAYQFASDGGPTFDKVFDVLSHAAIQYGDAAFNWRRAGGVAASVARMSVATSGLLIFRFPASRCAHAGYALKTLYNPSLRLG
jgi:uncharacterized protein YbjT (DUF2867 family)